MGGSDESSRLSGKKIPRKQTKPKLCVMSTSNSNTSVIEEKNCARKSENVPAVTASLNSDSNSLVETKAGNASCGTLDVDVDVDGSEGDEEEEEEEKGERELKGYSRSEVTVIDTSFGSWKSEKLVFRRKNVWKVREKKGKFRSFGRKKRKGNDGCEDVVVGGKKKAKGLASEEDNGDQSITPSSNEVSIRLYFRYYFAALLLSLSYLLILNDNECMCCGESKNLIPYYYCMLKFSCSVYHELMRSKV